MKRSKNQIMIFFLILALPTVLWFVFMATGLGEKLDYTTAEKREKHEIAENVSAENITTEIEAYYNDRVPFRSVILDMNSNINGAIEWPYNEVIEPAILGTSSLSGKPQILEEVPASVDLDPSLVPDVFDDSYFPYKEITSQVVRGRGKWYFLQSAMEDYQGTNIYWEDRIREDAEPFEALTKLCKEKGIELSYLVLPNKSSVYPEYMPTVEQAAESNVQVIERYMKENTDVNFDYIYEEMLAAKGDKNLYFKQDTHWNCFGTVVGVNGLLKLMGDETVIDPSKWTVTADEKVTGDLYNLAASVVGPQNCTEFNWIIDYRPEIKERVQWTGENKEVYAEAVSDAPNKKTVVIIGDSFRLSFMNYLPQIFSRTIYIHQDYLEQVDLSVLKEANVIILESVERNYGRLAQVSNYLLDGRLD